MNKKILVLPGWMNYIKLANQNSYAGVWKGKINKNTEADYIIGLSLGALVVLRDLNPNWKKIILVGPLLPKRSLPIWFYNWIKYILAEGLSLKNQVFNKNPLKFVVELFRCVRFLRIDFSKILDNIPSDKIVMVRGKNDEFFCDNKAVEFMRSRNIQVIEIEGVGHNWDEKFNIEIDKIISGP